MIMRTLGTEPAQQTVRQRPSTTVNFNPKTIEDIDTIFQNDCINDQDDLYGNTLLHYIVNNNSPLLDYLLSKKPNLDIPNKEGRTPIYYAKTPQTVDKLIKAGASIYNKDHTGKTFKDSNPKVFNEYMHYAKCVIS